MMKRHLAVSRRHSALIKGLMLSGLLALGGCGKGSFDAATPVQVTAMVAGQEYEVQPRDRVEPDADGGNISVRHELATDRKFVTLLTGSATLIKADTSAEGGSL